MAKATSSSKKKSRVKRKASPLAKAAVTLRSKSCKLPLRTAWAKARKSKVVAKEAMRLYSAECDLPLSEAWKQARAEALAATNPKPPRRARKNKGYDTDFSRELSMFDYHHPAYEQTTGPFSVTEAFTHGLQPANRRNPRRRARRNEGEVADFSRELSMFDYHAPQFEQTTGQFGISEAFTHGLQPANRRNPRKARRNTGKRASWPSLQSMEELVRAVKKHADRDGLDLTVGASGEGREKWSYQTGDNSYTGGAYAYPHWAVITVYPRTNAKDAAKEILSQWRSLTEWR